MVDRGGCMSLTPLPPINFSALADTMLSMAADVVPAWMPGGRHSSPEYICGSLQGGEGRSCSVNLTTGKWSDFQSGEAGHDLVSLYAAIHEISNGKAARQLAQEYSLESVAGIVKGAAPGSTPPAPRPPPPPKPARVSEPEGWRSVSPVPVNAVEVNFKHQHRQPEDIEHLAEYRIGEDLHGYVVRFRTSDGGKDTLPRTWCTSARDGGSRWHWKQWDAPRPLYFPGHALPGGRSVIMVEGEKKADALQALLDAGAAGVYCVATWPGGGKAWSKGTWAWLQGSAVMLWPDCDGKHESLNKAEREATPDKAAQIVLQQSKPLLPAHKQPGVSAMLAIGAELRDNHGCSVQILPIPEPGEVADGWDCADAIAEGWDFARVQAFLQRAYTLPADVHAAPEKPSPAGGGSGAGDPPRDRLADADELDDDDPFYGHLQFMVEKLKLKGVHEIVPNRSLLIAALRKAPALKDCVAYDDLRGAPVTKVGFPWRTEAGPLVDQDDLRFGDWLSRNYSLRSASRAALTEAMETVADERRFHPFRDWVKEQKWDGKPRTKKWLIHILGKDVATMPAKLREYLELVAHFMLLGHVARVMTPGCKFDYSIVLEGKAGMGKSTLPETLVGASFFSDTHFDIGSGKDGMEQLAGIIAYELSEMTAFRRADSEQVKAFFSSRKDRYRGAYGRYVQDHPRQCVIWCTTNKRQYLYDLTGNRRFWPISVDGPINIEWLRKWRGQLFAEAMVLFEKGERSYPTPEEEIRLFEPEQRKRLVETSVQARLYSLLSREGAVTGEGKSSTEITQHTQFVTIDQMTFALGADPAKSTPLLETQVRDWLTQHGWVRHRQGGGQRLWGYKQPDIWPPDIDDEAEEVKPANIDGPPATAEPFEDRDDAPF